jgi:hypothetical protein
MNTGARSTESRGGCVPSAVGLGRWCKLTGLGQVMQKAQGQLSSPGEENNSERQVEPPGHTVTSGPFGLDDACRTGQCVSGTSTCSPFPSSQGQDLGPRFPLSSRLTPPQHSSETLVTPRPPLGLPWHMIPGVSGPHSTCFVHISPFSASSQDSQAKALPWAQVITSSRLQCLGL